ncbi:Hypothetical predicted protein, partial [Mytilus galloprovincialis]
MEDFVIFLLLFGTAVFVPCVILQYECPWLEKVLKILNQRNADIDRLKNDIIEHFKNQTIYYAEEILNLRTAMDTLLIRKSLPVAGTTQDWNSKLKDDTINLNNAIEKMTEKTKTMLKRKKEANDEAIAKVKEAIIMQVKETEAFCSSEIAELKSEIAILLVEKGNGIRSEIRKGTSKEHIAFFASIPAASNSLSYHQAVVYSK